MATSTDPRAAGFDAAAFRDAIQFAMNMGLPQATADRITFRWTTQDDFAIEDQAGETYDWTGTPTATSAPDDVQIPAAVEFIPRSTLAGGTGIADFDTPRVVVTVLDTHWPQVTSEDGRRADRMVIGGNTYEINFVAPPLGLFGVTVYQIHGEAVDET